MLIINVLLLMVASALMGYYVGKGKIEITRPLQLTPELKEKLEQQLKEQEEAIKQYNEMCRNFSNY